MLREQFLVDVVFFCSEFLRESRGKRGREGRGKN